MGVTFWLVTAVIVGVSTDVVAATALGAWTDAAISDDAGRLAVLARAETEITDAATMAGVGRFEVPAIALAD